MNKRDYNDEEVKFEIQGKELNGILTHPPTESPHPHYQTLPPQPFDGRHHRLIIRGQFDGWVGIPFADRF